MTFTTVFTIRDAGLFSPRVSWLLFPLNGWTRRSNLQIATLHLALNLGKHARSSKHVYGRTRRAAAAVIISVDRGCRHWFVVCRFAKWENNCVHIFIKSWPKRCILKAIPKKALIFIVIVTFFAYTFDFV